MSVSWDHSSERDKAGIAVETPKKKKKETYGLALRLGVDELLAKVVVLGAALRGAVDDNLLVVVRELEDDVLVLLVELEVVVGGYALLVDGGAV